MTNSTATPHRIYSNDLERERLRQASYAMTPNRLSLNRHRVYRAGARQLTVIAIVAHERQDSTLYNDARTALALPAGTRLDSTYEVVQSRRPSRARRTAFASNRMVRFEVLPETVTQGVFPLTEDRASQAAEDRVLV